MSKRKRTSSLPSVPTGNDDSHSSEEEEQSRRPPPPHLASLAAPQHPQFRLPPRPPPPRPALHGPPPPRPPVSSPLPRLPPPPPSRVTQQNQTQLLNLPQPRVFYDNPPPVYVIDKSDFRDVVQKLTGLPAHERFSDPHPIQPAHEMIRPPPLPQLSPSPPPLLNRGPFSTASGGFVRQVQPLSPLPPFTALHTAVESPISAYMPYLQSSNSNTDSDSKRFAGFSPLAPRWNNFAQPPPTQPLNVPHWPTAASSQRPPAPIQHPLIQSTLHSIANINLSQARYPPPPPPDTIDLSPANFFGNVNDPVIPQFHPRPQAPAGPGPNKNPEIAPPYPWAGTRRATVRSLEYLVSNGINLIYGECRCNICNQIHTISLDLTQKLKEVSDIVRNQYISWIDNPRYPDCNSCKSQNCLVPVINNHVKKRNVNWLFLLLGQWIECCRNTPQLRYFLKHNDLDYLDAPHDFQLHMTFLDIFQQLCPDDELFDPYN